MVKTRFEILLKYKHTKNKNIDIETKYKIYDSFLKNLKIWVKIASVGN